MTIKRLMSAMAAGALAALISACSAGSGGGGGSVTAPPAGSDPAAPTAPDVATGSPIAVGPTDWITFHHDNGRSGVAQGVARPGTLSVAWRAQLDGAVYGQPLLLGGMVIAATENDSVYGLAPSDGHVLWRTSLSQPEPRSALPCGDISPLGVTSTMAYDPATGSLFVLGETLGKRHLLSALSPATGAMRWQRYAEPTAGVAADTQQRSALTVAFGHVYISYGGLAGDCGGYVGSVVGIPTSGTGSQLTYSIPTPRQAGIWTPGGATVDGNRLLVAVGNGAESGGFDGSDSVLALTPELTRADFFAPTTWLQDNQADLDLGSMTPALVGDHVLIAGKSGAAYVMQADHLGGIGGQTAQAQVCAAFGAAAIDGATAYLPCHGAGITAVSVNAQGTGVSVLWHAGSNSAYDSPAIGGGAVWSMNDGAGTLAALDEQTGAVLAQVNVGASPHFASPTLAPGRAYVGTMSGVTAVAASGS